MVVVPIFRIFVVFSCHSECNTINCDLFSVSACWDEKRVLITDHAVVKDRSEGVGGDGQNGDAKLASEANGSSEASKTQVQKMVNL